MIRSKNISGFTLVEIAIVLLIVTIILGYTMAMVPVQQELKQYQQADREMNKITEAVYAFAQVNGYLPCPALPASNGFECRDGNATEDGGCETTNAANTCDVWYGFVPGKTLGIEGKYSATNGLLLDPWGKPYRYQVTDNDFGGSPGEDFVIKDEMSNETMPNLSPDLNVCYDDPSPGVAGATPETSCGAAPNTLINDAPAVILSTGKDTNDLVNPNNSWIQSENLDNSAADTVFVKTTRNNTAGGEYDDLVRWIAPNILYSKMIAAGQLP